jgi:hypothetical protein
MMMMAEAERSAVNDKMLGFLGQFLKQGEDKIQLLKKQNSKTN